MPLYPEPPGLRFAYDIDGTVVKVFESDGSVALTTPITLDLATTQTLNNEADDGYEFTTTFDSENVMVSWLFPQPRSMLGIYMNLAVRPDLFVTETSTDTTDGVDGTWTSHGAPVVTTIDTGPVRPGFRSNIYTLPAPFSDVGIRGYRIAFLHYVPPGFVYNLRALHLYGTIPTATGSFGISAVNTTAVALSRGDSWVPNQPLNVSVPGGGAVTNFKVTTEALTSPAGRTLTEQVLISAAPPPSTVPSDDFVSALGPQTFTFSTDLFAAPFVVTPMLALAPDADLGGPWCFRHRVDGDGKNSAATYFYIDEVGTGEPVYPVLTSVAPNTGLTAGVSLVTLIARGVGATQAERGALLHVHGTGDAIGYDSGPLTASSWIMVSADVNAYTASREISGSVCSPDHVAITFVVPSGTAGMTLGVELDITGTRFGYVPTYTAAGGLTVAADTPNLAGTAGGNRAYFSRGRV